MHSCWNPSKVVPTVYQYKARHIPTNRTWIRKVEFMHRGLFLAKLAEWNRSDPKNWIYTEVVDNSN